MMATPASAADSPLSLKPDFHEATERWNAFWDGEMLDRPSVHISCPNPDVEPAPRPNYWTMLHDRIDEVVAATDA